MRPLKYIACGIIGFAIPFVVTFLFSGCLLKDAVGLDRSRTTDNRTTNITINEAQGEAFYRDGDGWTWVLDKFCTVIDGPFDLTGDKDPEAPKPTAPNPPPPCEGQVLIPEQANVWWLLLILLAAPGCAINFAANGRASLIDTAEVQPSLALSVGSRVHAASSASKANAKSGTEADAEGGTSSESSEEPETEPEGNEQ